jgi:hypothetical protein
VSTRGLTQGERRLAEDVFGEAVDYKRLTLIMGAPTGGWAISLFGLIVFPREVADFAAESEYLQAWFIHELAHAWQFQTRPVWTLTSWVSVAITGGYFTRRAYRYALPIVWDRLNLEQQAKVIEHRFLLGQGLKTADMPQGAVLNAYPDQMKSRRYATKGASAGGIG